jgi:hypothetical protein
VKSNIPAKLYRIRSFGVMKLEEFKDLLSPQEYALALNHKPATPSWFTLPTKVFIAFLYRVSTHSSPPDASIWQLIYGASYSSSNIALCSSEKLW